MNIALFFGSFNPIHNGHIHIANHILKTGICNEVWFVISPQNPLKKDKSLLNENLRLKLTKKLINNVNNFKVCDIEYSLPKPSYTYNTLKILRSMHEEHSFHLIIGGDNLDIFNMWRDHEKILEEFKLIVYPRKGNKQKELKHPNIIKLEASLKNISSTDIRDRIKKDKTINDLVPISILEDVISYYSDTFS
jgi:nicotinate-nucleotide adenylyltransferase